jgi:hypothetical protein
MNTDWTDLDKIKLNPCWSVYSVPSIWLENCRNSKPFHALGRVLAHEELLQKSTCRDKERRNMERNLASAKETKDESTHIAACTF